MSHFRDGLEQLRLWLVAAIVSPGWAWVTEHWAGFWWSSPVVWICIFWLGDLVLGSTRALYDGWTHPADPRRLRELQAQLQAAPDDATLQAEVERLQENAARGFRPRRCAKSVLKLCAWLAVLMIAWGMRDSHMVGGVLAASCLEAGVLLTEASSVLKHLGELTGAPFLRFYATKFERQANPGGK